MKPPASPNHPLTSIWIDLQHAIAHAAQTARAHGLVVAIGRAAS